MSEKYDEYERAAVMRRAEEVTDPLARARRVANGEWTGLDSPEDAREFLRTVEEVRRADNEVRWLEQDLARYERSSEARAAKHRAQALEIGLIRRKLDNSLQGHLHSAGELLGDKVDQRLDDESYKRFRMSVNRASEEQSLSRQLGELQACHEAEAKELRVVNERPIYGPHSEASWFVDISVVADRMAAGALAGAAFSQVSPAEAEERLARYAREVRRDYLKQGQRGAQIRAIVRDRNRHQDVDIHRRKVREEIRALTTGGGATASASGGGGAAFVPPSFILDAWAPFRGVQRTFANQCQPWPLPSYGMEVYVPVFTAGTSTSQQTELAGDPTASLQGAEVQSISGQVTISQQLHDRGFTGGGAFDQVMAKQLKQQLDQSLDLYVLNQVIANGASVTGSSSFSIANFYQDLAKGREQLTDTAGVRLRPTGLFTTSDLYSYVTRQVDATTNRPIVVPTYAPGYPISTGADDGLQGDQRAPKWSRFTGTVLPGGVLWFTDDNIPASGSDTQLIVSAPDEAVVLAESDTLILSVFPETYAGSLDVVVNLRAYAVAVTRHTAGTATIVGSAYTTSLV